jgi:hypothetical protein
MDLSRISSMMSEAAYNVYVMTLTSTSSRRIVIDELGRLAKAGDDG